VPFELLTISDPDEECYVVINLQFTSGTTGLPKAESFSGYAPIKYLMKLALDINQFQHSLLDASEFVKQRSSHRRSDQSELERLAL